MLDKPGYKCYNKGTQGREVNEMTELRENLLDRIIAIYGFEHNITVAFAKACESADFTDEVLTTVVEVHEANPQWDEDEE